MIDLAQSGLAHCRVKQLEQCGMKILVTGATGLIGSAIARV
jgi:FlaA1/EpsC-like NDP-sugar epimerase